MRPDTATWWEKYRMRSNKLPEIQPMTREEAEDISEKIAESPFVGDLPRVGNPYPRV